VTELLIGQSSVNGGIAASITTNSLVCGARRKEAIISAPFFGCGCGVSVEQHKFRPKTNRKKQKRQTRQKQNIKTTK
jgi:hypothetical protein